MAEYSEAKKIGDIGEEEILKQINKKYPLAYIDNTGKANSDWDIYIPEISEGIEVKIDYMSTITKNIVIEVEMNNKLSALSITKAKYWVFITGTRFIWVTPLEIYRFIEQHFEYGRIPFIGDGDSTSKKAYLINEFKFVEHVRGLNKEFGWVEMIHVNDVLYNNKLNK